MIAAASSAEVADLLAGGALALAFWLLTRRRPAAMLVAVQAQSGAVAAVGAWRAWAEGSATPGTVALAVLLGGCIGLPWLRRGRAATGFETLDDAPRVVGSLAMAGLLTVLATLAIHIPGMPPVGDDLAMALSVVLLALLMLATRRTALAHLVALHALANGLALVAIAVAAPITVAAAVAVMFGFAAVGGFTTPAAEGAP